MFWFTKLNQNELQYWQLLRCLNPACRPGREPELFFIYLRSGSDLRKGFEDYAVETISSRERSLTADLWPNMPGSSLYFPWRRRVFYRKARGTAKGQISPANPSEPFIEVRHPIMETVSRIPEHVQTQDSRLSEWDKWTRGFESANGRSANVSEHLHFLESLPPLQKPDTTPISSTVKIHNLELVSPECQQDTIRALAKGMSLLGPERRGRKRGSIVAYADDPQGLDRDLRQAYKRHFGKRSVPNTRKYRAVIAMPELEIDEGTLRQRMIDFDIKWPGATTSHPGKK